MNYDEFFEDLRIEALKSAPSEDEKKREDFMRELSKVPEILTFDSRSFEGSIDALDKLLSTMPKQLPNLKEILLSVRETLHIASCAVWFRMEAEKKLMQAVMDNPLKVQAELKFLRAKNKE